MISDVFGLFVAINASFGLFCFKMAIFGSKLLFWPKNGHFDLKKKKKDQKGFVLATDSPKTSEIITTDVLGRFKTEYRSKYSFLTLLTYY